MPGNLDTNIDIFAEANKVGRDDPIWWMENVLKFKFYKKNREMVMAYHEHDDSSFRAAKGVSKTYTLAAIALHFLLCRDGYVVISGPKYQQIVETFWRRGIHDLLTRSIIPPSIKRDKGPGKDAWHITPEISIVTISTSESTTGNIQGAHAPRLLLIVDEAGAVPDTIIDKLSATQASRGVEGTIAKRIYSGNPNQEVGCTRFKQSQSPTSEFHKIHISAFDSPNVTGECVIKGLTGMNYIEKVKRESGENSLTYFVDILGEYFEHGAIDRLIPESILSDSMLRPAPQRLRVGRGPLAPIRNSIAQGFDYARFGDDSTVSYILQNGEFIDVSEQNGMDEVDAACWLAERARAFGVHRTAIDCTGLGAGVASIIKHDYPDVAVVEVSFQSNALDSEKYNNMRTEMAVELRNDIRNGLIKLNDKIPLKFWEDARALTYTHEGKRMKLVGKKEVKMKIGRSPDHFDAAMLAAKAYKMARSQTTEERAAYSLYEGISKMGYKIKTKQGALI